MRGAAVAVTLAAMLLASGVQAHEWHDFAFSKSDRHIMRHTVEVAVDTKARDNHLVMVMIRIDRVKGKPDRTLWADSETCPAMLPILAKTQTIEAFKIVPPGVRGGASSVVLDGNQYEIDASGYWVKADSNGRITLSGNSGPVADWVEGALKALAPCWAGQPPRN